MTSHTEEADCIRVALQEHLQARGEAGSDLVPISNPAMSNRSVLYKFFSGTTQTTYLVKRPVAGDSPIDSNPPLKAVEQYEALERAHRWFQREDAHGVARPVAHLKDVDALAMHFVDGPDLGQIVRRSLWDVTTADRATRAAGDFLRRLHRHAAAGAAEVDLKELADEVVSVSQQELKNMSGDVPATLFRLMSSVKERTVTTPMVLLHGDYVPRNLILTGEHEVTMIDPSLVRTGIAEDDLARFLAVLSSDSVFVPGIGVPRVRKVRRQLETSLRVGYGSSAEGSVMLELRLLKQLLLRWKRRREFSRLAGRSALMRGRSLVIDAHMRSLVDEATARLEESMHILRH